MTDSRTKDHRAAPSSSLRFKILREHVPDCAAVEMTRKRVWTTPWAYLREVQYRDSAGRLQSKNIGRGRRWWVIGCNHHGCPAEIAVDELTILEGLPRD